MKKSRSRKHANASIDYSGTDFESLLLSISLHFRQKFLYKLWFFCLQITVGRGRNPETELGALKRYFSGDNGWIDDIFNNQHQPIDVHDVKHSTEAANPEDIIEEPSNPDENDECEWMTEDDDDIDDAESLIMTPTKVILLFKWKLAFLQFYVFTSSYIYLKYVCL